MTPEKSALRFARQDEETLALLARVQWETGYVPTMDELGQLLQCPTMGAARRRLEEMLISGEGTRVTPEERREMQAIIERVIDEQQPPKRPMNRPPRHRGHNRTTMSPLGQRSSPSQLTTSLCGCEDACCRRISPR